MKMWLGTYQVLATRRFKPNVLLRNKLGAVEARLALKLGLISKAIKCLLNALTACKQKQG